MFETFKGVSGSRMMGAGFWWLHGQHRRSWSRGYFKRLRGWKPIEGELNLFLDSSPREL